MNGLQTAVTRLQQATLNTDLTVRGVPENDREKLKDVIIEVFKKIDDELNPNIVSIFRLGTKSAEIHRSILVKLSMPQEKSQLIAKKIKVQLNCSEIIVKNKPIGKLEDKIFFGEHLAAANSKIYYIARQLVKKKQLFAAWTRNGKVFVRKADGGDAEIVEHEEYFKTVLDLGHDGNEAERGDAGGECRKSMAILEECISSAKKQPKKSARIASKAAK